MYPRAGADFNGKMDSIDDLFCEVIEEEILDLSIQFTGVMQWRGKRSLPGIFYTPAKKKESKKKVQMSELEKLRQPTPSSLVSLEELEIIPKMQSFYCWNGAVLP